MGLRSGPGVERGVIGSLAGRAAVEQTWDAWATGVGVGKAGEHVVDNDGLSGLVGLGPQG